VRRVVDGPPWFPVQAGISASAGGGAGSATGGDARRPPWMAQLPGARRGQIRENKTCCAQREFIDWMVVTTRNRGRRTGWGPRQQRHRKGKTGSSMTATESPSRGGFVARKPGDLLPLVRPQDQTGKTRTNQPVCAVWYTRVRPKAAGRTLAGAVVSVAVAGPSNARQQTWVAESLLLCCVWWVWALVGPAIGLSRTSAGRDGLRWPRWATGRRLQGAVLMLRDGWQAGYVSVSPLG